MLCISFVYIAALRQGADHGTIILCNIRLQPVKNKINIQPLTLYAGMVIRFYLLALQLVFSLKAAECCYICALCSGEANLCRGEGAHEHSR